MYKKFHKDLRIVVEKNGIKVKVGLNFPRKIKRTSRKDISRFKPNAISVHEALNFSYVKKLTKSNFLEICRVCGAKTDIQMHHIRAVKDHKKKKRGWDFEFQMAMINRKQIPLCKRCHYLVHKSQKHPHLINTPAFATLNSFYKSGGLKHSK